MEDVGVFCGHLVYSVAICCILCPFGILCGQWYILWPFGTIFSPFWYVVPRKNLATLMIEDLPADLFLLPLGLPCRRRFLVVLRPLLAGQPLVHLLVRVGWLLRANADRRAEEKLGFIFLHFLKFKIPIKT
jgi:hypothetical protein